MNGNTQRPNALSLFCFEGVDPVRLDTFRRCLALTFLIYMASWFGNASEWLTDYGFHYTVQTERYSKPDPFPTMPGWMVPFFGAVMFGSTICLIAEYRVRIASWVVLGCAVYVQRVDMISAFTLNKLYILCFAVLALSSPPRDVVSSNGSLRQLQSVWPIRILQATLLIQYFTAGWCKCLYGDWLVIKDPGTGRWFFEEPILWTHAQGLYRTDIAAFLLNHLPKWGWAVLMYGSLAFELIGPLMFTMRRLAPFAMLWGIAFHMGIGLTMHKLVFFSLQMMSFYVLFVSPEALNRARSWFIRPWPGGGTTKRAATGAILGTHPK